MWGGYSFIEQKDKGVLLRVQYRLGVTDDCDGRCSDLWLTMFSRYPRWVFIRFKTCPQIDCLEWFKFKTFWHKSSDILLNKNLVECSSCVGGNDKIYHSFRQILLTL